MRNGWTRRLAATFVILGALACGGDEGPADVPGVDAPDAADLPGDPGGTDAEPDAPADAADASDAPDDGPDAACPVPPGEPPVDPARRKFALSMFHFNIQYVAGGLVTEWKGQPLTLCGFLFGDDSMCEGWDDDRLNDWIIQVTFEPVLDLYLKHPTWHVTLEMPALMLEIIAERHPGVLAKMRQGVGTGQFEFVSIHWSDQLFLAFPTADMDRSLAETVGTFSRYCIPLSGVVFNQEGQSGPGKHVYMAKNGYTIDLVNSYQFRYSQKDAVIWPLYQDNGVDVIVGGGPGEVQYDASADLDVAWTFFDDGEVLAAPGNPYLAPITPEPDKNSLDIYEGRVAALEAKGYAISTVTDFVRHAKARGVEARPMPAYVEGTWHPEDTQNMHLWLGKRSKAANYNDHERDSLIRSTNYQVSRELLAAEVLANHAMKAGKDVSDLALSMIDGWRHLLRAEVSDATGITPWQGEFNYATAANDAARSAAATIRDTVVQRLGWQHARIDLAAGTATKLDQAPVPETREPLAPPPVEVTVEAPTRTVETLWTQSPSLNAAVLDVNLGAGEDPTAKDVAKCKVTVTFPRFEDRILYSPGLANDRVIDRPFTDFAFGAPEVWLPLANGLVGLGNGTWVVKDCRTFHVTARIAVGAGEKVVQFVDETAAPEGVHWRFYVLKGTKEEALALANAVNVTPVIEF